jgi:hypothetical protein
MPLQRNHLSDNLAEYQGHLPESLAHLPPDDYLRFRYTAWPVAFQRLSFQALTATLPGTNPDRQARTTSVSENEDI